MRAFLIDPTSRTISQLEHDGSLGDMYQKMGCDTVDRVALNFELDMWVDDNGHLAPGNNIFELFGNPTRFADKALILGHDGEGTSISVKRPIEKFLQIVRWTELMTSGDIGPGHTEGAIIYGGMPIAELRAPDTYLIWSNEHGRWWGPGSAGYVETLKDAGRYSRQHALQICRDARGGWDGRRPPPEVPVRTLDAIAAGLEGRYP